MISLVISIAALLLSAATAWFTLFRRGSLGMTQPTVIFFGPDGGTPNRGPRPKVFLRTLLFATSKRGQLVESLHIRLSRGESKQNFNIWVYGDHDKLLRGSGLYVGENGVATNHHFLLPEDAPPFRFLAGKYQIDVLARILGRRRQRLLFSQDLEVAAEDAQALTESNAGLYFDWGPDSSKYYPHIDVRSTRGASNEMLELLNSSPGDGTSEHSTHNLPSAL